MCFFFSHDVSDSKHIKNKKNKALTETEIANSNMGELTAGLFAGLKTTPRRRLEIRRSTPVGSAAPTPHESLRFNPSDGSQQSAFARDASASALGSALRLGTRACAHALCCAPHDATSGPSCCATKPIEEPTQEFGKEGRKLRFCTAQNTVFGRDRATLSPAR